MQMINFISFLNVIFIFKIESTLGKKEKPDAAFISKEIEVLEETEKCSLSVNSRSAVHSAWLNSQVGDETVLCLLKFLHKSPDDGLVWSLIGTSYDKRSAKKKADHCFKQSAKILGKHSEFVKEWHYLAPFVIGKIEFDGDPLFAHGGIFNVSKYRLSVKPSPQFFSELIPQGLLGWAKVKQSQANTLVQIRPGINWNDLVSSLGSLGITEWQGWAVGDLVVNEPNMLMTFQCLGVSRCYINSNLVIGDLYHRDYFQNPVVLPRGVHTVYVPLRAKVTAGFKFSVASKLPKFEVFKPLFLPDLYDGYFPSKVYLAVAICNRMGQKGLKLTKVELLKQSDGKILDLQLLKPDFLIAPGQTIPVIVEIRISEDVNTRIIDSCRENSIELDMKFKTSEGSQTVNVRLRCRQRGSSFLFTFIDHDGSVQHAAAIEPLASDSCENGACPVVLSLHGTTVSPQNQADSYKKMVDGEFQFGVKDMWLLAPTRHGAHNWEGPGAVTAMTALENLKKLSSDKNLFKYQADPSKVVFAGHSMGGHGAWHLATHFPDRAIGLVSLAGWIKKEEYGDSNLFFRHDISNSYVDPSLKSIMEACVAENDADRHCSNLKGIPVLTRIGANDRTVHPLFVRRMLRVLKAAEVDVTYSELPGLEHWWWDTKEANDGGCVNDGQIRNFLDQIKSKLDLETPLVLPESGTCSKDDVEGCNASNDEGKNKLSGTVTLEVFNPALGEGLKGVVILQQLIPFRRSSVEINVEEDFASFTTTNAACLEVRDIPVPNRSFNLHRLKTLKRFSNKTEGVVSYT